MRSVFCAIFDLVSFFFRRKSISADFVFCPNAVSALVLWWNCATGEKVIVTETRTTTTTEIEIGIEKPNSTLSKWWAEFLSLWISFASLKCAFWVVSCQYTVIVCIVLMFAQLKYHFRRWLNVFCVRIWFLFLRSLCIPNAAIFECFACYLLAFEMGLLSFTSFFFFPRCCAFVTLQKLYGCWAVCLCFSIIWVFILASGTSQWFSVYFVSLSVCFSFFLIYCSFHLYWLI